MKTKVLLVLVLGIGIGFGVVLGLVVLPEKAEAEVPYETLIKPYTPEFEDWVTVYLRTHLPIRGRLSVREGLGNRLALHRGRFAGGKWVITIFASLAETKRRFHPKTPGPRTGLEDDKFIAFERIKRWCKEWEKQGYDIDVDRDFEWEIHWFPR